VKKRRRSLFKPEYDIDDNIPEKYRHIRNGKRGIVKDSICEAMADLDAHHFSLHQIQTALLIIGNKCFGRNWQMPYEQSEDKEENYDEDIRIYDQDELPTRKAIRGTLKKIEVHRLSLVAQKIQKEHEKGSTICHATDSTTRKNVGTFAVGGLHINNKEFLPLPSLYVTSETTKNVAATISQELDLLAKASNISADEIYHTVNVHLTDSTAHNKNLATELAKTHHRDDPAGQIFCDTHTTLSFERYSKMVVSKIENEMGVEHLHDNFILDTGIDQKDSIYATTVSWTLNLFGPDHIQKPWNYNRDFKVHCENRNRKVHLFALKDMRFEALSKCSAILCYHWRDFKQFLSSHDYVTNQLACLVRNALDLEYIPIVTAVISAIGIHVVSPYHALTKSVHATHSRLKVTFTALHHQLQYNSVTDAFFTFEYPAFESIPVNLFQAVKLDYSPEVVTSITDMANQNMEECITLVQMILPELANTLAMQRGKYYDFGDFPREYQVEEQTQNIDATPVHNLQMERLCGQMDTRISGRGNIETASRGLVLKHSAHLVEELSPEQRSHFRKMGANVAAYKKSAKDWIIKQKSIEVENLAKKEGDALKKEAKKLATLNILKRHGGPFSSLEEVESFLNHYKLGEKDVDTRLKLEVTYARDSSVSLPRSSDVFRIFKTTGRGIKSTRRLLTGEEFANNLKQYFGKTSQRSTVTLLDFKTALMTVAVTD
jgi:hypothetical protein